MNINVSIALEIWTSKYRFSGKGNLPADTDFAATAALDTPVSLLTGANLLKRSFVHQK